MSESATYPNVVKCVMCSRSVPRYSINHLGRCDTCQRRADDAEQERRNEDARRSYNMCMGDMLNTGIPGGIDMDISTPI